MVLASAIQVEGLLGYCQLMHSHPQSCQFQGLAALVETGFCFF